MSLGNIFTYRMQGHVLFLQIVSLTYVVVPFSLPIMVGIEGDTLHWNKKYYLHA